jgi:hypothetical protein
MPRSLKGKCQAWNPYAGMCTLSKGHKPFNPLVGGKRYPAAGPHRDKHGDQFRASSKPHR